MLKVHKYPAKKKWAEIIQRPNAKDLPVKAVKTILKEIKAKGDKAVRKYSRKFDKINNEEAILSDELKQAIQQAMKNIETFHAAQKDEAILIQTMPGVCCWRKSVPIEKVGLYVPGGSAPLFSTVLMLAVPAQLAGCKEIILCSPSSHPAILYAAELCGITKIFKVGGAQAIAAMAYGTKTIPKVQKIFGPGNPFVTLAKQLVQLEGTAIDMPAGPSELLIIADDSANPEFVVADLLSQAEHGPDSQVLLVTSSNILVKEVNIELAEQLKNLPRQETAEKALANSKIILVKDIEEAVEFSNLYAPEHLILACGDARQLAEQITSAGSVFIGHYSPESAGDYASGTNHVLPTNGYAAMYGGISLDSFCKKITYQEITKAGLKNISSAVMIMAEAEGLTAHKKAVECRIK